MKLTCHESNSIRIWAADGKSLSRVRSLGELLAVDHTAMHEQIEREMAKPTEAPVVAPVDDGQEVWAAGVTYLRSREARMEESDTADIYDKVYDAERAEVFFKGNGWRVRGPGQGIRVRRDSGWDVPEPELAIVINAHGQIVGYTVGNDVSSRSIEGENPLYLPQAKVYDGSAALGPAIELCDVDAMRSLPITMRIERDGSTVFEGETNTSELKRTPEELAECLTREMPFPQGVILMTGTCLVPDEQFTLTQGDVVTIGVGSLELSNPVVP